MSTKRNFQDFDMRALYLPQYTDEESQQQDPGQDSDEDDPPGDPVLVCQSRLRIDHHWNLEGWIQCKTFKGIPLILHIFAVIPFKEQ